MEFLRAQNGLSEFRISRFRYFGCPFDGFTDDLVSYTRVVRITSNDRFLDPIYLLRKFVYDPTSLALVPLCLY